MWLILLLILTSLLFLFYTISVNQYQYWKKRGVPFLKPLPIVGNMLSVCTFKHSQGQFYKSVYEKSKNQKYIGIYEMQVPVLVANDPGLIEKILVKDFKYFVNRDVPQNRTGSEVDAMMFALRDSEWRAVRTKLNPAFSTGKLKYLYSNMMTCADSLEKSINFSNKKSVDLKELSTMFSLEVIGNCVFGIDVTNEKDKDSEFRKMGRRIFNLTTWRYLQFVLMSTYPSFAEKLGLSFTEKEVGDYFAKVIKASFNLRKASKEQRNDFMQILLQLQEKGSIDFVSKDPDDSYLDMGDGPPAETIEITDTIVISQAYLFLTAGFDGLSSTMMFTLYELALHPEYQERVRKEILVALQEHGSLSYEALKTAKFLDKCINEELRKYPLAQFLFRECGKEYELDDGVTIPVGTKVIIPIYGLHYDPSYFPDPEKYNPDRWDDSMMTATVSNFTYLPFGAGPRMCIGMRFALAEVKLGIATILSKYKIKLNPKTPVPLKLKPKSFTTIPSHPVLFDVEAI